MFHTCFWGKHDVTYAVALVAIVAPNRPPLLIHSDVT